MKAYARLSMLTKLKYVGVGIEVLINIYVLFIRSWILPMGDIGEETDRAKWRGGSTTKNQYKFAGKKSEA